MRLAFSLLFLSATTYASHILDRRQSSADADAQFSSAASQLISLYLPPSVVSAIVLAASSHSITGTPAAIVESAITAASTPSWLTAIPSAYQPNVKSLDSAISALRVAASEGSISGAPRVVTSTDGAGNTVTTIVPGHSRSAERVSSIPPSNTASAVTTSGQSGTAAASLTTLTGTVEQSPTTATGPSQSSATDQSGLAIIARPPNIILGILGILGAVIPF